MWNGDEHKDKASGGREKEKVHEDLGGCVSDNANSNLQEPVRHLFATKQERKQRHADLSSRIQPDQGRRAVDVFFYSIVLDENDSSSSPNDVRDTT